MFFANLEVENHKLKIEKIKKSKISVIYVRVRARESRKNRVISRCGCCKTSRNAKFATF